MTGGVAMLGAAERLRKKRYPGRDGPIPAVLLLLTGATEADALAPWLARYNSTCRIVRVTGIDAIETTLDREGGNRTRLVAFCTAVIVPRRILARLGCGAYNFHPGPPSYPGRFPSCWGSYDEVSRFGATLHEMSPRVDEGQIVAVEWFAVAPPIGHGALSDRAFRATVDLFRRFAPRLAVAPTLPTDPAIVWSGPKRRLVDYEAMCRLPPDIGAVEFARRRRAFADLPGARLTLQLHGATFTWRAPQTECTQ